MIRKNKISFRPLYREVVKESLGVAWHKRWLWPYAILAGILQTGGILDVILYRAKILPDQGRSVAAHVWFLNGPALGWFEIMGLAQGLLYALLLVCAVLALSVIGQGALAYGLAGRVRGRAATWRECLTIGARKLWPVALLNVITLGLLWVAHFLVLLPLAFTITTPTLLTVITYFLAYLLFLVASVGLTAIHLFALNALVLQDASLWQALIRGYELLTRSWIVILETAGILLVIGMGVMAAAVAVFLVASIPLFVVLITAALLQYPIAVLVGIRIVMAFFFLLMLAAGGFTIVFQYAVWVRLYHRLGEGGAFAKLHRWYRQFVGAS